MTADKIVNNIKGLTLLSVDDYKEFKKNIPNINDAWWLRSPYAYDDFSAALVYDDGSVDYFNVGNGNAARPALKISSLESTSMEIGDKFDFGGRSFTVISDTYALCDESLGRCVFRHDWRAENANIYKASDIKAFIEDWYEKALEQIQDREQEDNGHDDPEADRAKAKKEMVLQNIEDVLKSYFETLKQTQETNKAVVESLKDYEYILKENKRLILENRALKEELESLKGDLIYADIEEEIERQ